MEKVVYNYLRLLKIPISQEYFKSLIECHSQYPYLISIADTLEKLGIPYNFLKVTQKDICDELFPFLMHIDNNNNADLVIISSNADLKKYSNVLPYWSGLILKIDPIKIINDAQNKDYRTKERKSRVIFALLLSIIGLIEILISYFYFSGYILSVLITNLVGAFLGYFLIKSEFGQNSSIIDKFCSLKNSNNCLKVLSSLKSKISLPELTLIYFVFQFFFIVSLPFISLEVYKVTSLLFLLSLLTLPVVAFSVIYQYYVVKAWCNLCLLVDLVLIIQAGIFYTKFELLNLRLDFHEITFLLLNATISFLFILLIVVILNLHRSAFELKSEQRRLKRVFWNSYVFKHYLFKQPKLKLETYEDDFEIGSKDAQVKLTLVIDLFCSSCWTAFQTVSEILLLFPEKINLVIRFSEIEEGGSELSQLLPSDYILAYFNERIKNKEESVIISINLIDKWFKLKSFKEFKQQYNLTDHTYYNRFVEQGKRNREWIESNNIDHVPTLFVNGYKMPDQYKVNELKNFVNDLSC